MSEALPPHVGPLTPSHRRGHCQFNPKLDGKDLCNAPADRHFWVGPPDGVLDVEVWTSYACEEHWETAYDLVHPVDWHPVTDECLVIEGARWRWSTNDRPGFCYTETDEAVEAVAVLELAGGISQDSPTPTTSV